MNNRGNSYIKEANYKINHIPPSADNDQIDLFSQGKTNYTTNHQRESDVS